jgi:hypothetical protein
VLLIRRLLASRTGEGARGPAGGATAVDPAGGGAEPQRSPALTREQLYREAARLGVRGRSKMTKQQLQDAVEAARKGGDS